MAEICDFTSVLRTFMARALRSNSDLAQLTSISVRTIEKWTAGEVHRPRYGTDVLKVAQALGLSATDTSALLTAAGFPALPILYIQARQASDTKVLALLTAWEAIDVTAAASATQAPRLTSLHQLRAPVGDFVGRADEIVQVTTALHDAARTGGVAAISGVQGMGGIGKTELAYAVAHRLRHVFPDAQIVLPLYGSSATPLTAVQAVQTVIRAFRPEARLPDELPSLERLYRSVLHDQRVLILADDAHDAAQVRALLPPAGSALLLTSRTRFMLPAMTTIDLEQLLEAEAHTLLRQICPRLTMSEAQALALACGYLPLALRVAGSMLRSSPALSVAAYLVQLADVRQRLAHLRDPYDAGLDVAASLSLSYAQLDATMQRVFRQLGVLNGDFDADLVQAVMARGGERDGEGELHELLRRNLVVYDVERARWRLHDLVRDLARHYLEVADEWTTTMWRYTRATMRMAQDIRDQYLTGGDKALVALARFDAERAHTDAAYRWALEHTQTPEGDQLLLDLSLATSYIGIFRYNPRQEVLPVWNRVCSAARRLGNRKAEERALGYLGIAYGRLSELRTSIWYFEQSLAIAREVGDRDSESVALNNLGIVYNHLGELPTAITCSEHALAIAHEVGYRHGEGIVLENLGIAYHHLGELPTAITCFEQSLAIAREVGNRQSEGVVLGHLGNIYTDLGDTSRAITYCEAALTIARANGDREEEGCSLSYLARVQARRGDIAQALTTFAVALALLQDIGYRLGAAEEQWHFGIALVQQGEREHALPLLRTALAHQQEIGHAKAAKHAAWIARLEAGEDLLVELPPIARQRAVREDSDTLPDVAQP
jgi:tetratricopeptide (TPR) repeat protein